MLNNLLIYRLVIINALLVSGVIWGYTKGYIYQLFAGETTGISYGIVVVFLFGMIGFAQRAYKTSKALNAVKKGIMVDPRKFHIKNSYIGSISVYLVTLGLIGNIIGFSIAVKQLNVTGDVSQAMSSMSLMTEAMNIAFHTTLVGIALGLWMSINNGILKTATALLRIDAMDLRIERGYTSYGTR